MAEFFESQSFVSPSRVKEDVAGRLGEVKAVKAVEFLVRGDALEGAKEFSEILLNLKKRGVRVSHEFTIRLDFPRSIPKDKALSLVQAMPSSKNGSLKVRIWQEDALQAPAESKP
ncbi:MAG: hypothetical protein A3C47_02415 [Omnitrophica bacterium RIFCSPHIGHO2_02_FULL_51_18]|nr:MAG: hypothetical protein A3C47_02415 [Omnitrophica bacterium RIFCSPHIGHO2_02_FULL_51_18]